MASDIDELLEWMRREEAASRDAPNRTRSADMLALFAKDAELFARWIAAVEELVANQAKANTQTEIPDGDQTDD